jgi:hypothetical protein
MPPEVAALHEYIRDLIAAERGLGVGAVDVPPTVVHTDTGVHTRAGGVWTIDARSHGYAIETVRSGGSAHRVRFWAHDPRHPVVAIEVTYRTADIPRADLRRYASQVGLLAADVEREGAPA